MDDLISRQVAIDALETTSFDDYGDYMITRELIEQLPSAQPERKTGKWSIKNGELAFWDVCSECGRMVIHRTPFYNFCPHCGARMED